VRRRLALAAAAITTTIVLAFAIPLGLIIRTVANDRAIATAERAAQAIAPVLATGVDPVIISSVVANVSDPLTADVSVVRADGTVLGAPVEIDDSITLARIDFRSFSTLVPGGRRVLVPVQRTDGSIDVISVFVPSDQLEKGVRTAWLLLAGLSVTLVAVAVAVADRLARTIVVPVGELAATAELLGQGELDARVSPAGPPEIIEVGHVLNRLAERIGELLAAERELVADLSHRLRTPITALRLDADSLRDETEREQVSTDVDELVRAVDRVIDEARRPGRQGMIVAADLAEVTRQRVRFWAVLAEDQGRAFDTGIVPGPCPVAVRRDELEAALDAALGNVLAHTPDGTAFRVMVGPAERRSGDGAPNRGAGPAWLLVVEDDGPGFAEPGVLERGTSGAGSTGLGLDIVRRTAEHSGGRFVMARSSTGGARLEVTFAAPSP
jgi:signal transduction histidine kinase